MKEFAYGFSEKLRIHAVKNRPPFSNLTQKQIKFLASLADYRVQERTTNSFTIWHNDNKHGIDNGLYVVWYVRTDGSNLIYFPLLQSHYIRGCSTPEDIQIDEMILNMTMFLPTLGFQPQILVPLDEEAVILPQELTGRKPFQVMFVSEFREKYEQLYLYLQRIFDNG